MRILGSSIELQLGSLMKWGHRWVVDDDDFFPDSVVGTNQEYLSKKELLKYLEVDGHESSLYA